MKIPVALFAVDKDVPIVTVTGAGAFRRAVA
jgi:hypothetical protein